MESSEFSWDLLLLGITAAGTLAAAVAAARAARQTKRASEASVLLNLFRHYSSASMHRAILMIREWNRSDPIDKGSDLDGARRMVSHHFQSVVRLVELGLLSRKVARAAISSGEADLFLKTVRRMERTINLNYDLRPFEDFANLVGRPLRSDVETT